MELAYDINLFRVDSNIFHATKDIQYPPLFKILINIKEYFTINSDTASLDSFYMIFAHNLDNFNQSYNFDTPTFTLLINENIELINVINNQHQLLIDLTFIKLSMKYRVNSITFLKKLKYQLTLFSQNQEPSFDLSQLIINREMNKESLAMAIFMTPVVLEKQTDRDYYLSLIDTIEDGEELFPLKQIIKDSINNFYSTTNADLVLKVIQFIQPILTSMLDDYIASKFEVMLLINKDITETSKTETSDNKLFIMNSMVSTELSNEVSISSQSVSYATNNSAQNLPVRDEQMSEDIILVNLDNESKSNTAIIADNTNQIVISMKNNNLIIANENEKIITASNQLDMSNQVISDEAIALNNDPNYILSEESMTSKKVKIDISTQQISVSTNIIKSKSLEQNVLMTNYKKVSGQNKEANSTLVTPLKALNLEASNTMTNTDAIMNISKGNISVSTISMDNSLLALGSITTALIDTRYPNRTIETGFSLLVLPIRAVLSTVNGLICILEALQCLAVGLAKGIVDLAVFLTDLATAQSDFENLDANLLQIIEDLKSSIMNEYNSNILNANCSAISEVAKEQEAEVKLLLLEDSEMVIDWTPSAQEACAEWALTISQGIIDQIIAEFVLFVDELKDGMQTIVSNMLGLLDVSECKAINLDTEFDGIRMIELSFPDLKFPNFKIDIPRVELKVKPC